MGSIKAAGILILALAAVFCVLVLLVRLLEDRLTFHPLRELEFRPDEFGLACEEVILQAGRHDSLYGWFFPPADSLSPVLLVFHGNAGNISHRLEWIAPFVRRGLGVLLFDYRGYGRSSGKPSEAAFREDALAAWEHLTVRRGLAPGRIVPVGRSIGAAPAVFLSAGHKPGALVLEGAFTSGRDMARQIFGLLPLHLAARDRWEVAQCLAGVSCPVLIIHGSADRVVPFVLGERLSRVPKPGLCQWWLVEGGGHLDCHYLLGKQYYDRLEGFVREQCAKVRP